MSLFFWINLLYIKLKKIYDPIELEDNKVDKLKIAYKTTEDSFVEYADLIENKTHDILSFEYQRNKDISHKLIFEKIHERYNERKNDNKIYR